MAAKAELLSPAGDRERLRLAVLYGADAVYLAGRQFGMRSSAVNFSDEDLRWAVDYAHARGVKIYVTCNTLPREAELRELPAYLEFLQEAGVDALIIADLGVLELAKLHAPRVARHVSTQFGVINSATANALFRLGADTVVLARETPLEDIRKIRDSTPPELRIEAFVHGAMCVSFSVPVAACCPIISPGGTPTGANAPSPAAGSITWWRRRARDSISRSPRTAAPIS